MNELTRTKLEKRKREERKLNRKKFYFVEDIITISDEIMFAGFEIIHFV